MGMPFSMSHVESNQLPHYESSRQNGFFALISEKRRGCAACLLLQQQVCKTASQKPQTLSCPAGLSETAVPLLLGDRLIGYLQTGQALLKKPTKTQWRMTLGHLQELGIVVDPESAKALHFQSHVKTPKRYEAAVRLLEFFARQLAVVASRIAKVKSSDTHPAVIRAKQFIDEHPVEGLTLAMVAEHTDTSRDELGELFHRFTGEALTEYVSRVRIARAKDLLLNLNYSIGEVAREVGFESTSEFNHAFRKLFGKSANDFRCQLPDTWESHPQVTGSAKTPRPLSHRSRRRLGNVFVSERELGLKDSHAGATLWNRRESCLPLAPA